MARKLKIFLSFAFIALILSSCATQLAAWNTFSSANMGRLELGMSRQEVTEIMGRGHTIVERRMEYGNDIEVWSFTNHSVSRQEEREFYLFRFVNGRLEGWSREFFPRTETIIRQN